MRKSDSEAEAPSTSGTGEQIAVDSSRRPLGWFWSGRFASAFGSALTTLIAPYYLAVVLHLDAVAVSLVMAGPVVATLLSPLYAGIIADSVDRKLLTISCDFLQFVLLVMLGAITLWGPDGLLPFGIANFLLAIVSSVSAVGLMAGFPDIVGEDRLHAGNARLQTFNTIAHSAGGLSGGAVMSFLGPFTALIVNSLAYLMSSVSLLFTRWPNAKPHTVGKNKEPYMRRVAHGFVLVRKKPLLLVLVMTSTVANFFITLSAVALLWLLVREIQLPYFMYVLILSIGSLGAAVGATLSFRIASWTGSNQRAQLLSLSLYAVLLAGYTLLDGTGVATVIFAAAVDFGVGFVVSVYIVNNAVQQQVLVPSTDRGSVGAVRSFGSALAGVLGTASSGVLIALFTGRGTVVFCAIGLAMVALRFTFHVFRRAEVLDS
ncbi:MFS transporter [Paenarthrobacter nitroguajacolicus]|uniref:MFS transporter n=1 Tax=Paenarthrobacter nitroguajacolicus TaxID=211146 RepID=UPI003AD8A4E7